MAGKRKSKRKTGGRNTPARQRRESEAVQEVGRDPLLHPVKVKREPEVPPRKNREQVLGMRYEEVQRKHDSLKRVQDVMQAELDRRDGGSETELREAVAALEARDRVELVRRFAHLTATGEEDSASALRKLGFEPAYTATADGVEWHDERLKRALDGDLVLWTDDAQTSDGMPYQDIQMVVGGDTTDTQTLTGLALNPEGTHIVGTTPGTPAAEKGWYEASKITGLPVHGGALSYAAGIKDRDLDISLSFEDGKPVVSGPDREEWLGALRTMALMLPESDSRNDKVNAARELIALLDGGDPTALIRHQVEKGHLARTPEVERLLAGETLPKHEFEAVLRQAAAQGAEAHRDATFQEVAAKSPALAAGMRMMEGVPPEEALRAAEQGAPGVDVRMIQDDSGRVAGMEASAPVLAPRAEGDGNLNAPDHPNADPSEHRALHERRNALGGGGPPDGLTRDVARIWPEDEPPGVRLMLERPIPITYVGLANIIAAAAAHGLPTGLNEEGLRRTNPRKRHEVVEGWRCHSEEHGTFVRVAIKVRPRETRDNQRADAFLVLQDMPAVTWEALTGEGPAMPAHKLWTGPEEDDSGYGVHSLMPHEGRYAMDDMPRWAGARAFDKVWRRALDLAQLGYDSVDGGFDVADHPVARKGLKAQGNATLRASVGWSMLTLAGLYQATEVLCDPDQVNAIPQFDSWEDAVTYAGELHLPFDQLFLDMEGPAKQCVVIPYPGDSDWQLVVRGAHVSRGSGGELVVIPYGGTVHPDEQHPDDPVTYQALGTIVFGHQMDQPVIAMQSVMEDGYLNAFLAADPAGMTYWDLPVTEPSGAMVQTLFDAHTEVPRGAFAAGTGVIVSAASAALRALFLIGMSNVEIVDAPLTRQIRRQAARKGDQISLAVIVRTNSKRYLRREGDDEAHHREYSHRFRVRGHVKHYPVGTRMADADPTKVVACPRCGRCRRIWTPPFIKGPDDKPLVIKSLVVDAGSDQPTHVEDPGDDD